MTVSTGGVTFADDREIELMLAGTATQGTDYTVDSETLTLTAGETSVATMVTALDDAVDEDDETIDITAEGATTRVTITDDDESRFTVTATPELIAEAGGTTTVTVSTGGVTFADDRQIELMLSGTATQGTDYTVDSEMLTLTAGETSVATMVTAVDDAVDEDDETIDITAEGATTRVTITDDDESRFTVTATPTVDRRGRRYDDGDGVDGRGDVRGRPSDRADAVGHGDPGDRLHGGLGDADADGG